jgi:nucleoside-diphosphate-sugar epimerase
MKILVTGGAGFIGSNFVLGLRAQRPDVEIVDVDLLTYAGNLENLAPLEGDEGHVFVRADVADRKSMEAVFAEHKPEGVLHFAAESHVDRSILDAAVRRPRVGTQVCRAARGVRFVHVPPTRSTARSGRVVTSPKRRRSSRTRRTRRARPAATCSCARPCTRTTWTA